eukprot:29778-Pelagococcus_subviridis.AAC.5
MDGVAEVRGGCTSRTTRNANATTRTKFSFSFENVIPAIKSSRPRHATPRPLPSHFPRARTAGRDAARRERGRVVVVAGAGAGRRRRRRHSGNQRRHPSRRRHRVLPRRARRREGDAQGTAPRARRTRPRRCSEELKSYCGPTSFSTDATGPTGRYGHYSRKTLTRCGGLFSRGDSQRAFDLSVRERQTEPLAEYFPHRARRRRRLPLLRRPRPCRPRDAHDGLVQQPDAFAFAVAVAAGADADAKRFDAPRELEQRRRVPGHQRRRVEHAFEASVLSRVERLVRVFHVISRHVISCRHVVSRHFISRAVPVPVRPRLARQHVQRASRAQEFALQRGLLPDGHQPVPRDVDLPLADGPRRRRPRAGVGAGDG